MWFLKLPLKLGLIIIEFWSNYNFKSYIRYGSIKRLSLILLIKVYKKTKQSLENKAKESAGKMRITMAIVIEKLVRWDWEDSTKWGKAYLEHSHWGSPCVGNILQTSFQRIFVDGTIEQKISFIGLSILTKKMV